MPIIDIQRRLAECGRIRIGRQVPAGNGKTRPEKLDTFRLTSPDKLKIEQAAGLYGGEPQPWQAPAGPQWELFTASAVLSVIVPPSDMAFSQWFELWSAGGCQRRCDGQSESISEGPCLCDPENRECDIHSRLSVMLRDLPGLGVWRIDTQGYYAAVELQGAVEVIRLAAGRGQMLPARLRLEQRQAKRPGQSVRRFAVPVLDIAVSPGQLLAPAGGPPALAAGDAPAPLTPVPETLPRPPARPVADQIRQAGKPRAPRRNAAQPVPATGLPPRTAAEAARQGPPGALPEDAGPGPSAPAGDEPGAAPGSVTTEQIERLQAIYHTTFRLPKTARPAIISLSERIIGRELSGPVRGRTHSNLSSSEAEDLISELDDLAPEALPGLLDPLRAEPGPEI